MKNSANTETSAGTVGSPKRSIRAEVRADEQPERARWRTTGRRARPPRRRSCRAAGRARPRRGRRRATAVSSDGEGDVDQRRDRVRAGALLHPQQRVGELEVRERPQAERGGAHHVGPLGAEQQLGDRRRRTTAISAGRHRGEREQRRRWPCAPGAAGARGRRRGSGSARTPRRARAAARSSRGSRRQHQLGGAVVGPREMAGVDRQQGERDDLRDGVGELVRRARRSRRRR